MFLFSKSGKLIPAISFCVGRGSSLYLLSIKWSMAVPLIKHLWYAVIQGLVSSNGGQRQIKILEQSNENIMLPFFYIIKIKIPSSCMIDARESK